MVDTHPELIEEGYDDKSYILQTDFGNTFTMTKEEVLRGYWLVRVEDDPLGRMNRQRELLEDCMEKYYNALIR